MDLLKLGEKREDAEGLDRGVFPRIREWEDGDGKIENPEETQVRHKKKEGAVYPVLKLSRVLFPQ